MKKKISVVTQWEGSDVGTVLAAFTNEDSAEKFAEYVEGRNPGSVSEDIYIDLVDLDPEPDTWTFLYENVKENYK